MTTTKTRVLLVDDSKFMRSSAQKMLSGEFDLVTAEHGEDGWRTLLADTSIHVVFTDLSMPGLDGFGLLERIRSAEDPGVHDIPVIVVTGAENDKAARMRALELGATDFITKPFNSTDLLARARAHANYQRVTKRLQARSVVDPLTGLTNKAAFLERLQQDISFAKRHRQPLSLVRLEIDDFKNLFLRHGKDTADAVIVHVAGIVGASIRKEDTAARTGLASFALSLPAGTVAGSKVLAERICAEVAAAAVAAGGKSIALTLSGAVVAADPAPDATKALEACQRVLIAAMADNGNRVLVSGESAPAPVRIDALLDQLAKGDEAGVAAQLPQALKRLKPLFRLLDDRQRAQLVETLEQAETAE